MEFVLFSEISKNRSLLLVCSLLTQRNMDDGATQRKGGSFRVGSAETLVWID